MTGISDALVEQEQSIVWDEDPTPWEYIREGWVVDSSPTADVGIALGQGMQRIGYGVLRPDARPSHVSPVYRSYQRRYFYLLAGDRGRADDDGAYATGCPGEAVDPLTVSPGVRGIQNPRVWGGPLEKVFPTSKTPRHGEGGGTTFLDRARALEQRATPRRTTFLDRARALDDQADPTW